MVARSTPIIKRKEDGEGVEVYPPLNTEGEGVEVYPPLNTDNTGTSQLPLLWNDTTCLVPVVVTAPV